MIRRKSIFTNITVPCFVVIFLFVISPAAYFIETRVAASLLIHRLKEYRRSHPNYPDNLKTFRFLGLHRLNYQTYGNAKTYSLKIRFYPYPLEYRYDSYSDRWYGGLRETLENRFALWQEARFSEAQKKVDWKTALRIAKTSILFARFCKDFKDIRLGDAYQMQGLAYMGAGNRQAVLENLQLAKEYYTQSVTVDENRMFVFFCNTALFYTEIGDFERSNEYFKKALGLLETFPQLHNKRIPEAIIGLANTYAQLGNSKEALEIYKSALRHAREWKISKAVILTGLAEIDVRAGDFESAEHLYRKALKSLRHEENVNERNEAQIRLNLAVVETRLGKHKAAKKRIRQAIKILERYPEWNAMKLLEAKNALAVTTFNAGQYEEGAQMFKELIADYERACGSESLYLVSPLFNLGTFYHKQGDFAVALEYLDRALAIWEKSGPEFETEIILLSLIAQCNDALSRSEPAAEAYNKLLPILIRRDGEDSESVRGVRKKIKQIMKKGHLK